MADLKDALHLDPFIPLRLGSGRPLPQALTLGTVAVGALQVGLCVSALVSLARSKPGDVRGSRVAWALASGINFVGPISYFLFGRKR